MRRDTRHGVSCEEEATNDGECTQHVLLVIYRAVASLKLTIWLGFVLFFAVVVARVFSSPELLHHHCR